jgi:hypothetical protein
MPPGPTPGGKIGTVLATQSAPTIQVGESHASGEFFNGILDFCSHGKSHA